MLEVIRFTMPERHVSHKFSNTTLGKYLNLLRGVFVNNYKQMVGFLPQQQLSDYSLVKVKRRLSLDYEVMSVDIDLFSIKKPDDVLVAVGVDPKDSSVKRVIVEQLSTTSVEDNLIYNYKRMTFQWGLFKLKLVNNFELSGTFTKLVIKNKEDLKKEQLFYLAKKIFEKKERRVIPFDELMERLFGKSVVKVEMVYKQKNDEFTDSGKKSERFTKKVQELIIEL